MHTRVRQTNSVCKMTPWSRRSPTGSWGNWTYNLNRFCSNQRSALEVADGATLVVISDAPTWGICNKKEKKYCICGWRRKREKGKAKEEWFETESGQPHQHDMVGKYTSRLSLTITPSVSCVGHSHLVALSLSLGSFVLLWAMQCRMVDECCCSCRWLWREISFHTAGRQYIPTVPSLSGRCWFSHTLCMYLSHFPGLWELTNWSNK